MPHVLSKKNEEKNTAQMGAYAVYLWRFGMNKNLRGNAYSTIVGKLSAVRWYHRRLGYVPAVNAAHGLLLSGIKRMTSPVTKKHPLTPKMLRALKGKLKLTNPKDQLLWGGIVLGYFFLLRRSEYLKVNGKWFPYVLQLGDIRFYDTNEDECPAHVARIVGIKLKGAKNNQYGRNEIRFQHATSDPILCPVMAARWIARAAKHYGTGPLDPALSMGGGSGVSAAWIIKVLKALAQSMGLDPKRYSSHSVRIGGSTILLNAGCDPLIIKLLGRWLSNCFEEYPVLLAQGTMGVSRLMC